LIRGSVRAALGAKLVASVKANASAGKTTVYTSAIKGVGIWHSNWDGLRLGLLALGYQRVLWLHLHCATHGVYRLGLGEEEEQYFCPTCQQPCEVSLLAEASRSSRFRSRLN
jgi:hypothetical protein